MKINVKQVEIDSNEDVVDLRVQKYIRDTIERYLPAGTYYIILDENMNIPPWSRQAK